jgi:exopolyphosphatase/guanosine-5'-triphosphate,3'-diphosphate pyrophosphatase
MAPVYSESLQLGAVRLTEQVGFSDPPTDTELAEAVVVASTLLQSVPSRAEPLFLVASGGTVANLAAMELATTTPAITADILHGTILTDTQIESRITLLAGMSLSERRHVPGLEPERADVIIAGAIIQLQILRRLQLTELTVSARGLRYGLLYSLLAL